MNSIETFEKKNKILEQITLPKEVKEITNFYQDLIYKLLSEAKEKEKLIDELINEANKKDDFNY